MSSKQNLSDKTTVTGYPSPITVVSKVSLLYNV